MGREPAAGSSPGWPSPESRAWPGGPGVPRRPAPARGQDPTVGAPGQARDPGDDRPGEEPAAGSRPIYVWNPGASTENFQAIPPPGENHKR